MKSTRLPLLLVFIILIATGCSGSGDPSTPPVDEVDLTRPGMSLAGSEAVYTGVLPSSGLQDYWVIPEDAGHDLIGIWRVRLWEDGTIEVIPRRTEQGHFNITSIILNCPTCLKIELGPPPGPNTFDFNITLKNPTAVTGYDITGIVRTSGDIKFLNPDSYTFLFSLPGDTTPNPYAAWDTGVGNRTFEGGASHTEMLRFEKGGLTKFTEMDYLFQASWPGNQEEPYGIWGLAANDEFQSDGSNMVELRCRVGDWQENIDSVTVDLTPIGGTPDTPMVFFEENIWKLGGLSYNATGQGIGTHLCKVTATSGGVSTYNYLPVTVVQSGPIMQGSFEVIYQNLPLDQPNGPTDGMDISVMGAENGEQVSMVFGHDDTYHFWRDGYSDGALGLYYGDTGAPITPFDMPNSRFDFADVTIPDTTADSIFTLKWGEANTSSEVLDGSTVPPIVARQRITLWNMLGDEGLKLTANVLVLGKDEGPPVTYDAIVRPVEYASGFRKDGLLHMALVFDSGDDTAFPVVDIMALKPPLDFETNPSIIGFEAALDEGSGPGVVNRDAVAGIDVDDSLLMEITGGYAGHAWIAVAEGAPENVLEIIDADIDVQNMVYNTIPLTFEPLDVEILPLKNAGQPSNWICVLCSDNVIRMFDYDGNFVASVGGLPYMNGAALRLDIDDTNLAIHVIHQGTTPMVTAYKWAG